MQVKLFNPLIKTDDTHIQSHIAPAGTRAGRGHFQVSWKDPTWTKGKDPGVALKRDMVNKWDMVPT